jgi:septum formation protein
MLPTATEPKQNRGWASQRKRKIIARFTGSVKKMSEKTIANPASARHAPDVRPLVLASTSRYRRMLLERLGIPFVAIAPRVDESPLAGEMPRQTALRLAEAKARSVDAAHANSLVIGSDQVADCDGGPVGKPGDPEHARAMLERLSGKTVVFHTGIALLDTASGRCATSLVDVRSTFRRLSSAEIATYVDREQPYDCAGAVKSEGLGIALFEAIESDDPTALIGLPLITLTSMLRDAGVAVLATRE